MRLPYSTNPLGRYDHNADEIKAFLGLAILLSGVFMLFGAAIFHSILPKVEAFNDIGREVMRVQGLPVFIVSYILGGLFTFWGAVLVIMRFDAGAQDFIWLFESAPKEEDSKDETDT